MANMVFTRSEIMDILETTGYKVIESRRTTPNEDCIIVDFLADEHFYCSDSSGAVKTNIQVTFLTRDITSKRSISNLMYENFNSPLTISYEDDNEWWLSVYEFQALVRGLNG